MILWNSDKFLCQLCQANNFLNFYAVIAAKRFQTRSEKEIEQLLRNKILKSTNEDINEVLTFELILKICDIFYIQITGICIILHQSCQKL